MKRDAIKAKEELNQIKLGAEEVHKSQWQGGDLPYYFALETFQKMDISLIFSMYLVL